MAQVSRLRYSAANRKMGQAVEGKQLLWGSSNRSQCLFRTSMAAFLSLAGQLHSRPQCATAASILHCGVRTRAACRPAALRHQVRKHSAGLQ